MTQILIVITGIIPLVAIYLAYQRSRDPLHPIMYIGPMMIYLYAFLPFVYVARGGLEEMVKRESQLWFAQSVHILSVAAFCAGCLWPQPKGRSKCLTTTPPRLRPAVRMQMERVSMILAFISIVAYLFLLTKAGGFVESYSRPKGGYAPGVSGYVTSLPYLSVLAIALLALARQGQRFRPSTGWLMLAYMIPHIIPGTLGGSRGASFIALITLAVAWFLVRAQRPSLPTMAVALVAIGIFMLFLKVYRKQIYIGSEMDTSPASITDLIAPAEVSISDATTYSWGLVLLTHHYGRYYWGRRYFAQLIVRPIPRQLWPTKYEDLGVGWMVTRPGSGGFHPLEWKEVLGWVPESGSSTGFVADTFAEFSWGGLVICFLAGLLYGGLWRNAVMKHGIWTVVYLESAAVSVYFVTQGTSSAWMYRLLFITLPTLAVWYWFVQPYIRRHGMSIPGTPAPPKLNTRAIARG